MTIDLNADMGELADEAREERLMPHITSANVACGAHAGDHETMRRTVDLARRYRVAIGAHPGYPDRESFGRIEMAMTPLEIEETVFEQVSALAEIAPELHHVKPHGALYNRAAKDTQTAEAIARGAARLNPNLVLVGLRGSVMLDAWRRLGFRVAAEGFADRRYEPDGSLRPRRFADALITQPEAAAAQAIRLAAGGGLDTLCIHSDTPGAPQIAAEVVRQLAAAGIRISALSG